MSTTIKQLTCGAVAFLCVVSAAAWADEAPAHQPAFSLEEIVETRAPGQFVLSPDRSTAVFNYASRYFGHPLFPDFGNDNNLFLVSLQTGERRQLTSGTRPKTYPVFSPDGNFVAYESEGDIWSVNVHTGVAARLTTNVASDRSAAWSPDGHSIAFISSRWGRPAIYVMDARGENEALRRITPEGTAGALPTWSPDGSFILFTGTRGESFYSREIYRVSAAGGGTIARITPDDGARNNLPTFSPDGRLVAYISDRAGYLNIWTMRPDGTEQHQLTHVAQDQDYPENDYLQTMGLHWSPDGTRLLYFTNRFGNLDLMVVTVATGATQAIETADGEHHPVGWKDNQTVAYVYENYRTPPDLFVKAMGGTARQMTFSNHVSYTPENFDQLESVSWQSADNVTIHGYFRHPSNMRPGERLPAIVTSHTYNVGQFYNQWNPIFDYIVQSGYVMLMVDHRGSNGYGVAFRDLPKGDWGFAQLKDIETAAAWLRARPEVDPARVGMMGYSMGGYMTLLSVGARPTLFRAAVDVFGLGEIYGDPLHDSKNYVWHIGGTELEKPEEYKKRSPVTYAAQIQTPLLMIGSDGDPIEPVTKTYNMIQALDKNHKKYEAYVYTNELHGLKMLDHQLDSYQRVVAFLDRYLKQ
ncbi:MAG TPA: S9 family peptidase [Candidatus Acidoferrales bacterium]|nr:S9 family peptidase [Candidatus Acidoferrales bacterium]